MVTHRNSYSDKSRKRRERQSSRHWAHFLLCAQGLRQKSALNPRDWVRALNKGSPSKRFKGGKNGFLLTSWIKTGILIWVLCGHLYFSHSRVTGNELAFPPETDRKPNKTNRATMFRYWTTGSVGLVMAEIRGTNEMSLSFLPREAFCITMWTGRPKQGHRSLPEAKQQRLGLGKDEASGICGAE